MLSARHVAGCDVEPNLSVNLKSVGGNPTQSLGLLFTNLSSIGAGMGHSWQSFGLAGGDVRVLTCVPLGSASLFGGTYLKLLKFDVYRENLSHGCKNHKRGSKNTTRGQSISPRGRENSSHRSENLSYGSKNTSSMCKNSTRRCSISTHDHENSRPGSKNLSCGSKNTAHRSENSTRGSSNSKVGQDISKSS